MIQIEKKSESQLIVYSSDFGIEQELNEYFKFRPKGFQFMPAYKNKIWSGWILMYDIHRKTIMYGLLPYIELFAQKYDYKIEYSPELLVKHRKITRREVKEFVDSLNTHTNGIKLVVRDYQYEAVYQSLNQRKLICQSPTASGKSLIIYAIIRYLLNCDKKIVLTVPTTSLVNQMYTDFEDYSSHNGWNVAEFCHMLFSGKDKETNHPVLISTYQSLHSMSKNKKIPKTFFTQWNALIGDECLHPDTIITMSDYSMKRICDIKPGEKVLTLNENTHNIEINSVIKVHKNISTNERVFKVKTKSGKELIITGNHKTLTSDGWKETQDLVVGNKLFTKYT